MTELLSWGAPLTVALACVGFAFAVLSVGERSADEFWIARGFFVLAAFVGVARISYWGLTTSRDVTTRLFTTVIALGLITGLAIESVRYVNRKHGRWTKQQSPAPSPASANPSKQEPKLDPNFVCSGQGLADVYFGDGMFYHDNPLLQREKATAALAAITNEFSASRKVGVARYVSAEVRYEADGDNRTVKRGSWVSQSGYKIDFHVNDRYDLIIAAVLNRVRPQVFFLARELFDFGEDLSNRAIVLTENLYRVSVRLIRESEGVVFKELDFSLAITREPKLQIELYQIKGDES